MDMQPSRPLMRIKIVHARFRWRLYPQPESFESDDE